MNIETVQRIPEECFCCYSGHGFGERYYKMLPGFQELVLVVPAKFDSRLIAIGLHRTREVTEFIVFNTNKPFEKRNDNGKDKNPIVFRISGGEVVGMLGKEKYYNRLVEPSRDKVLCKASMFRVMGMIYRTLDQLEISHHIDVLPKYVPLAKLRPLEVLTKDTVGDF